MKNKGTVFKALFFIAVFALTIYSVFYGEDLEAIGAAIRGTHYRWFVLACFCMVVFILGEAASIKYLLHALGVSIGWFKSFLISGIGFFYNSITPSATGGQPMQLYYLKKMDVPYSVSTPIVMIVTIAYKMVLVCIGLPIIFFNKSLFGSYLQEVHFLLYLGMILNVGCVAVMLVMLLHMSLASHVAHWGLRVLTKLRIIRDFEKMEAKLVRSMTHYHETASVIREKKYMFFHVFVISFVQRAFFFLITWCIYKSFGLSGTSIVNILILQLAISAAVDMLPFPGGMGVSEFMFSKIFQPVFGNTLLVPAMLLVRGIGFYGQIVLGGICTVTIMFVMRHHEKKEKHGDINK